MTLYLNGSTGISGVDGSSGTPAVQGTDTNTGISFPAADTVAVNTGGSERVRCDSSGRVGIGTTSPQERLTVDDGNGSATIRLGGNATYYGLLKHDYFGSDIQLGFYGTDGSQRIRFLTQGTERCRIDSSGRLLVGTSSSSGYLESRSIIEAASNQLALSIKSVTVGSQALDCWNTATSNNNVFVAFATEGSRIERALIDYNRAAGQVRYNVSSDRRLKSDIAPAQSALGALSAIEVRSYKWAETGYQIDFGFIAQELNEVAPDAVKVGDDGEEVTDTWAVDNGKLVPLLTKALQEAIAKIETLEAKVAALEAA